MLSNVAFARPSITSEGQIQLGQRSFLSDPDKIPAQYQKSGGFVWATPILQIAGEKTRFRFKGIAGIDQGEFEQSKRTQLIPQELFVEHQRSQWNFVAGMNTYNWGVTDVVNPMDVINPRWARQPLNPIKIGSFGLAMTYTTHSGGWDFVYIPKQFPHELPTTTSRSIPRDVSVAGYVAEFQEQAATIQMPTAPLRPQIEKYEDPGHALDNNVALRYRQTLGSLDLHVMAFEGMPSFPDFSNPQVTLNPINLAPIVLELSPDVVVVPKYQRIRMASVGGVWSLSNFLVKFVHAETWRTSNDYEISLPQTSVLAIEKPVGFFGLDTTLLYQYSIVKDTSGLAESVFSTREIFDQTHMLGLRSASGFNWNVLLALLFNPRTQSQVTNLEGQYRLNDEVQLKLASQIIQGKEGSLANALRSSSNIELSLLVFW